MNTIKISEPVKKRLDKLKIIVREPYYSVIDKLIDFYYDNNIEDEQGDQDEK